ncbi:MAG: diphosphomevalonate decarboxylase [Deltaproteobacteria bacterium]|nr:diphosphomevalonate decarboxylase [Deltaproteobacteria bacterium]
MNHQFPDHLVKSVERRVTGRACSNVALAKYWGKRDVSLNLPYTGSLSVTLDGLETTATVEIESGKTSRTILNGVLTSGPEADRIRGFLDLVRLAAGSRSVASAELASNFPVAAGIASSASTFAALAVAAAAAYGVSLTATQLSILARRGSGSAARSIFGGYTEWLPGEASDGTDSFAVRLAEPEHWRLGIAVVITNERPKSVGSRSGMAHAAKTSPFFPAWLTSHEDDLADIRRGILDRNLTLVGETAEHNCLKMHAVSLTSRPALLYWKPATLAVIETVYELRAGGIEAYFTIDAGPQVKVLCANEQIGIVAAALANAPGVKRVLRSGPGNDAHVVEAA